jgi:hypothetical protein
MVGGYKLAILLALLVGATMPVLMVRSDELLELFAGSVRAPMPVEMIWRNELLELLAHSVGAPMPVQVIGSHELLEVLAHPIGAPVPVLVIGRNKLLKVLAAAVLAPVPVLMIIWHHLLEVAAAGIVATLVKTHAIQACHEHKQRDNSFDDRLHEEPPGRSLTVAGYFGEPPFQDQPTSQKADRTNAPPSPPKVQRDGAWPGAVTFIGFF